MPGFSEDTKECYVITTSEYRNLKRLAKSACDKEEARQKAEARSGVSGQNIPAPYVAPSNEEKKVAQPFGKTSSSVKNSILSAVPDFKIKALKIIIEFKKDPDIIDFDTSTGDFSVFGETFVDEEGSPIHVRTVVKFILSSTSANPFTPSQVKKLFLALRRIRFPTSLARNPSVLKVLEKRRKRKKHPDPSSFKPDVGELWATPTTTKESKPFAKNNYAPRPA